MKKIFNINDVKSMNEFYQQQAKRKLNFNEISGEVDAIISSIRKDKDSALLNYTNEFDNNQLSQEDLKLDKNILSKSTENISRELYSQDFIELQVCHMLEGTHGGSNGEKSISRALSTLNSQIGFVRSLGTEEVRSISRLSNDMYDEDSFAATYSLAQVTEGTVLGEYEDGQRDVIDVVTSTKVQLSTWNDSNSISSGHAENNMDVGSLKSSEH